MHQRKMIPNLQVVLVMNPKLEAGLACRSLPLLLEQLFCIRLEGSMSGGISVLTNRRHKFFDFMDLGRLSFPFYIIKRLKMGQIGVFS